MLGDLITLPIRLSAQAATLALRTTERVATVAFDLAGRVMPRRGEDTDDGSAERDSGQTPAEESRAGSEAQGRRGAATGTRREGAGAEGRDNGASAAAGTDTDTDTATATGTGEPESDPAAAAEAALRAREEADEPAAPAPADPEPAHVSEEPTLVEEFAEPGAEDGAGPQLHIEEPWPGYREMTAQDIIDRLAGASPAEVSVVSLYETAHSARKTVLEAAQRRLKSSQSPEATQSGGHDIDG